MYPEISQLTEFLTQAHQHSYANEKAERVASLRPDSKDYHFQEGDFTYHDTYFGGRKFIGEEIIYWRGRPIWGMNYHGFALAEESESFFDSIMRPALMATPWDELPVRGPKHFQKESFEYVMQIREGNIERFSAEERVISSDDVIYRAYLHGGLIQ